MEGVVRACVRPTALQAVDKSPCVGCAGDEVFLSGAVWACWEAPSKQLHNRRCCESTDRHRHGRACMHAHTDTDCALHRGWLSIVAVLRRVR